MNLEDIIELFDENFLDALGIGALFSSAALIIQKSRYPFYEPNTLMPTEVPFSLDESVKKALTEILQQNKSEGLKSQPELKEKLSQIEYKPKERLVSPNRESDFAIRTLSIRKPTEILAKMDFVRGIIFSSVFSAIEKKKEFEDMKDLSYFTLDIPLKNPKGKVDLVRLTRYLGKTQAEFHILKPYQMEPMFPRLFFTKEDKLIGKDLPDFVRFDAVAIFRKYLGKQKFPFTPRHCEMLNMILANPSISSAMIAERMNITQDSVRSYLKEVALTAFRLFETLFNPRKDVALYWHEMGLFFPKS